MMARNLSGLFAASRLMLARLLGAGAGFLTQLFLARLLSTEDLGVFFAATSFAALSGLVATQGYPGVMQRFIVRYRERGLEQLLGLFVWQVQAETILFTMAVALAVAIVGISYPGLNFDHRLVFISVSLCVAAAASLTVFGALASVERRFDVAQLPENLIRPVAFLSVLLAVPVMGTALSLGMITIVYAALTVTLAGAQYALLVPVVRASVRVTAPALAARWRAEARLFAPAMIFATSFADLAILLSSPFLGTASLAPFGIALKTSLLLGFAVQVAHQIALPDLAEAQVRGDVAGRSRSIWQATVFPSVVTGAALIAAAVAGERFMMLFGAEYAAAKWALVILIGAQFLRAVAGPGQSLLMLRGDQAINAAICMASTLALALLNAILAPLYGVYGASIAVLLTVALWFGAAGYILSRRAGIRVDLPFLLMHATSK